MSTIRPPLPPPLTHQGITFVLDSSRNGGEISQARLAEIAYALSTALPPGEFSVTEGGSLLYAESGQLSPWGIAGRFEALRRGDG